MEARELKIEKLPADAAEPECDGARVRPPVGVDLRTAAPAGGGGAGRRDGRHDVEDGAANHDRPLPPPPPIGGSGRTR